MSNEDVQEVLEVTTPLFKALKYRSRKDRPSYYRGDELCITIFPEDLQKAHLTEVEITRAEQEAKRRKVAIEYCLQEAKLKKAGHLKYFDLQSRDLLAKEAEPSATTSQQQPSTSAAATSSAETVNPFLALIPEPGSLSAEETVRINPIDFKEATPGPEEYEVITMSFPEHLKRAIEDLEEDVKGVETRLNRHTATSPISIELVEVILERLKDLTRKNEELFSKIRSLDPAIDISAIRPKRGEIDDEIDLLMAKAKRIIRGLTPASQSRPQSNPQPGPARFDLPKFVIPKFSGDWKEWLAFKDTFKEMVLDLPEAQLTAVKKFHYLRQSLHGDALRTIESIPTTGADVKLVWQELCNKYDNTRRLTQGYLADLENQKPMTESSSTQLRRLYEDMNAIRN